MDHTGHIEQNGTGYQVYAGGVFCGATYDQALAERHLANVLARLNGQQPASQTMTVEQFSHDHTRLDPTFNDGRRRAVRPALFQGMPIYGLVPSRHQGFYHLFTQDAMRISARDCDIIELAAREE